MAERFEKALVKNNNKNRIRLKVKEKPKMSRSNQIAKIRKKDRNMKFAISLFTFMILATMASFLIIKRINFSNDRFE